MILPVLLWAILLLPVSAALLSYTSITTEGLRRVTVALALALLALTLWLAAGWSPWPTPDDAAGSLLPSVDALSAHLLPFAAGLWVLAVGVTPRRALDRGGLRRTALATSLTLVTFTSHAPVLLASLWVASVAVFLGALSGAPFTRARRIARIYLGLSTILVVVGVALPTFGPWGGVAGTTCIVSAVLIRKGIFPLHSWVPEVFSNGRLGPAILFSAPQCGAYVAARLVVPDAPDWLLTVIGELALVTAVYGALAAVFQSDARRAVGYLFISQSALVMTGLECVTAEGLTGGLCVWLSSGLAFAGLARTLLVLESRRGRLSLARWNGGYAQMPRLAVSFLLMGLACVGFPGTFGFVGQEILLAGVVEQFPRVGYTIVAATAITGIAVARMYFSLFCGSAGPRRVQLQLRSGELALFSAVAAALVIGGVAPRGLVRARAAAAHELLRARERRIHGESRYDHVGRDALETPSPGPK